jgi:hypothetical protein
MEMPLFTEVADVSSAFPMPLLLRSLNDALARVLAALDAVEAYNRAAPSGDDAAEKSRLWQALLDANRDYLATIDAVLKCSPDETPPNN